MPHFVLEYSSNVLDQPNFKEFFGRMHRALAERETFSINAMKSRAYQVDDYYVSDEERGQAFVHLELAILEGRDQALKLEVSAMLLKLLQAEFPITAQQANCAFSVEIRDIESSSYSKASSGNV